MEAQLRSNIPLKVRNAYLVKAKQVLIVLISGELTEVISIFFLVKQPSMLNSAWFVIGLNIRQTFKMFSLFFLFVAYR